mmetsp:Transcript_703/g.2184  ORF Transcript_703/g.2184 Transcript_703/m.2184 type:complete len:271 (+) Transcript_703:1036-1848(+)
MPLHLFDHLCNVAGAARQRDDGTVFLGSMLLLCLQQTLLNLRAEVPKQPLDGPGSCVAQGANGVPLHLVGEFQQLVNLVNSRFARLHAVHEAGHPVNTLAARRALRARLVLVEEGKARDVGDHVRRVVHDNHGTGAQGSLTLLEVVKVHERLGGDVLGNHRDGRATRNDTLQVVPATDDAAAVAVDELPQGDRHLFLYHARLVHVARDGKELGPVVVLPTKLGKPRAAASTDGRDDRDSLHIRHSRGAPKGTNVRGKGRLQPGLTRLALE